MSLEQAITATSTCSVIRDTFVAYVFILEKQFLQFFFKRLERNHTRRYQESFPFVSLCGRERNFVRCDDLPIVFTELLLSNSNMEQDHLSYACAGDLLTVPFSPQDICMLPSTGRVYHPGPTKSGGVGLVKSSLAFELSKYFEFNYGDKSPPTHFSWKTKKYLLSSGVIDMLEQLRREMLNSNASTML